MDDIVTKSKRPPLTMEQREAIAELRGEKGWSYNRIARHIGCGAGAVMWHCLLNGIDKPGPPPRVMRLGPMVVQRGAFVVRRFSDDDDKRLLALEAQGLNETEIGRLMDRRRNSIKGRLATLARREERALSRTEELPG